MPTPFEPYYVKIMTEIRRRIAVGEWPPGHKLPSTAKLTEEFRELFGARGSANVIRAIAELRASGELETHQGAGVWVPK
jgi:GntR family transcriptional regulator